MRGRGLGSIHEHNGKWRVQYRKRGQLHRKGGFPTEQAAADYLKAKLEEGARHVAPKLERITIDDLIDAYERHLDLKGARSLAQVRSHGRHIREAFGDWRAVDVEADDVEAFQAQQKRAGAKPASINRRVEVLRSALRLAQRKGKLPFIPHLERLPEDNVRKELFTRTELEAVCSHLPAVLADWCQLAYRLGWRAGDVRNLKWTAINRDEGYIRIYQSKTGRPVDIPLQGSLMEIIDRRWAARTFERNGETVESEYVFHGGRGRRVSDKWRYQHWYAACEAAGFSGRRDDEGSRILHDCRSAAGMAMQRAGVPDRSINSITGHTTDNSFRRYGRTQTEDRQVALERLDEYLGTNVKPFPKRKAK